MSSLTTQVIRSEKVESVHQAYAVICDAHGNIIRSFGDPEYPVYVRSSAKPMQAMASIRSGAYENFGFGLKELALICSSHSGEPVHTHIVEGIFAKAGISPDLLACGVHPPIDKTSAKQLQTAGLEPQQIHNNCSGKHAGMLASCVQMGFETADYLNPEHPVQRYIYEVVKEFTGEDHVHRGVDGCSAPVFYLPLLSLAKAFATISRRETRECRLVFDAMTTYPHLVGGTGRFDTLLMESFPGRILSKGGAEAVSAAAFTLPDGQIYGLAVKILDGNYRAIGQMVLSLLKEAGFWEGDTPEGLRRWWAPELKNHAGLIIGTMKTLIEN